MNLSVRGLEVAYPGCAPLRGVDLELASGESVAVLGESGAGKSTLALAVMGLLPPAARVRGEIWLDGRNLLALKDRELSRLRGRALAMVFQEPAAVLDPVRTVAAQLRAAIGVHERRPAAGPARPARRCCRSSSRRR
ncbi:ATP-binding cassette domain-containing protein, partial [Actinocorallia lasiicapitis]